MHSATSTQFPTARPMGWFMSVRKAVVGFRPLASPTATIDSASSLASSTLSWKAPSPYFTSSTRESGRSAIFLLMMLAVCSGRHETVAVTSRRA